MADEVAIIASRFHAGLFFGHCIALWFNLRNRKYLHAAVHLGFVIYDGVSAIRHQKEASNGTRAT